MKNARLVHGACTQAEHDAIRAVCCAHGTISQLVREVVARLGRAKLRASSGLSSPHRRYLGALLSTDEIAELGRAAQACGIEPTVLLRLAVTARARVGTGDALWRALCAARE